jgi:hypothetical protein
MLSEPVTLAAGPGCEADLQTRNAPRQPLNTRRRTTVISSQQAKARRKERATPVNQGALRRTVPAPQSTCRRLLTLRVTLVDSERPPPAALMAKVNVPAGVFLVVETVRTAFPLAVTAAGLNAPMDRPSGDELGLGRLSCVLRNPNTKRSSATGRDVPFIVLASRQPLQFRKSVFARERAPNGTSAPFLARS